MKYAFSFLAVIALVLIAWLGSQIPGMQYLFGVAIPYLAIMIFLGGFVYRVVQWAKSPVPFSIPTTCGQGVSLDFIKQDKLDCPTKTSEVVARMFLEIFMFRSLFRNTKSELHEGPKITYESSKWLWIFALLFHYSFLVIIVRHMRLFLNPVPAWLQFLDFMDAGAALQVGAPLLYASDLVLVLGVVLLFSRRLINRQVRYISLANDYFPLFLLLGIGISGFWLRHLAKGDIASIKAMVLGLTHFAPVVPESISPLFYGHLFLVSVLLMYIPFSKLTHMAGVFLSPTRNLANNNRAVRHVNPWDYPVKVHPYDEYEDELREKMIRAGLPVERQ